MFSLFITLSVVSVREVSVLYILLGLEGSMLIMMLGASWWIGSSVWSLLMVMVMAALEGAGGLALVVYMTRVVGDDSLKSVELTRGFRGAS